MLSGICNSWKIAKFWTFTFFSFLMPFLLPDPSKWVQWVHMLLNVIFVFVLILKLWILFNVFFWFQCDIIYLSIKVRFLYSNLSLKYMGQKMACNDTKLLQCPTCWSSKGLSILSSICWGVYLFSEHIVVVHSCHPIRSHIRKYLFTNMDFNMILCLALQSPGTCVTTVIWYCHKSLNQWQCSFQMKAALPLVNRLVTASDRNNGTGPSVSLFFFCVFFSLCVWLHQSTATYSLLLAAHLMGLPLRDGNNVCYCLFFLRLGIHSLFTKQLSPEKSYSIWFCKRGCSVIKSEFGMKQYIFFKYMSLVS